MQDTHGVVIQTVLDDCNGIKMQLNRHVFSGTADLIFLQDKMHRYDYTCKP